MKIDNVSVIFQDLISMPNLPDSEYTGSDYTLSPEHWKPRFRGEETALTLWYLIIMQ